MVHTGTAAALPTQLKQEEYTKPSKLYDNDHIRADKRMNAVHLINVMCPSCCNSQMERLWDIRPGQVLRS